jgi:hypothetical protein
MRKNDSTSSSSESSEGPSLFGQIFGAFAGGVAVSGIAALFRPRPTASLLGNAPERDNTGIYVSAVGVIVLLIVIVLLLQSKTRGG